MRVVGIDIGSFSIKVAEVSSSGLNSSIEKLSEYPLSQKPGVDKDLELITTLKEITSQYNPDDATFVLGLPQDKISTRILFFPFKEKFKILKSLPFELEDQIPFSASDAVFEAKVIKSMPVGSEVLAVAAPKSLIKDYLSLASDVQLDPDILSLEGFALNNLFEEIHSAPPIADSSLEAFEHDDEIEEDSEDDAEKNLISDSKSLSDGEAILDIGYSSSILIIRGDGSLHNIRRVNWGAKNLAKAVSQKFNIQEMEALQNIKASKGVLLNEKQGNSEELEFSDVLSKEIETLGRILKLTILEVKGVNSIDVKGIGLLGGLANLNNIGPKLTQYTQIACNRILKIKSYPELDLKTNANNELSMGVAIGLALEALRRPKNPAINFRQDEFKKENSTLINLWNDWGFYVNLAAASIAVFFVYSFLRSSLSEELAYSSKRSMQASAESVFKMKKQSVTERKLTKLFKDLDNRESTKVKILEKNKNDVNSPLRVLNRISEKALSRLDFPVDIKSLKVTAKKIEIEGVTKAKNKLDTFVKKLKPLASGKVSKTNRRHPSGGTLFTISFKPKKKM